MPNAHRDGRLPGVGKYQLDIEIARSQIATAEAQGEFFGTPPEPFDAAATEHAIASTPLHLDWFGVAGGDGRAHALLDVEAMAATGDGARSHGFFAERFKASRRAAQDTQSMDVLS
jgi:hypothetical protein